MGHDSDEPVSPQKTLTIEDNASYALVSTDGSTSQGKMDVKAGRNPLQGSPDGTRGQMMLYDATSGQIGTMWYEFTNAEMMEILEMDGTKYRVQRQK